VIEESVSDSIHDLHTMRNAVTRRVYEEAGNRWDEATRAPHDRIHVPIVCFPPYVILLLEYFMAVFLLLEYFMALNVVE
jgi:hypothetical protein